MPIIAPIPRTERCLMLKTIHKTKDKNHARRHTAMLMLHRDDTICHVASTLCCARSSIGRWINWFTLSGTEGLKSLPLGRGRRWSFGHICALVRELIKHSPGGFCYQRSRWSTELLAIKIRDISGCPLHASTIRRWLHATGLVWRRAAPTLRNRDRIRKKKWQRLMWRKPVVAPNNLCFTKMKWKFNSIPKSALTGRYSGSKSAFSRRSRIKVLSCRCTAQ